MYIWIILSMFITALYAFNLHVRQDSRSLYVEPQAQMVISKLSLQHDAAREFFRFAKISVASEIEAESKGFTPEVRTYKYTDSEGDEQSADITDVSMNLTIEESGGQITAGNYTDVYNSMMKVKGANPAKGAVTKVFCVKSKDLTSPDPFHSTNGDCVDKGDGNVSPSIRCCFGNEFVEYDAEGHMIGDSANTGQLYVVTYVPVPMRWRQRAQDGSPLPLPNRDMIKALHHFGSSGVNFGYFMRQGSGVGSIGSHGYFGATEGSGDVRDIQTDRLTDYESDDLTYVLKGFKDTTMMIPTYIGKQIEDACENPTCLVAISTADK